MQFYLLNLLGENLNDVKNNIKILLKSRQAAACLLIKLPILWNCHVTKLNNANTEAHLLGIYSWCQNRQYIDN